MGLTHYFHRRSTALTLDPDKFRAFQVDVLRIVCASNLGAVDLMVDADSVRFNGLGDDGYEQLSIARVYPLSFEQIKEMRQLIVIGGAPFVFDFCKTGGIRSGVHKYDPTVRAILLALHHHFPTEIAVRSDDEWSFEDEENGWRQACRLYADATHREWPSCPWMGKASTGADPVPNDR